MPRDNPEDDEEESANLNVKNEHRTVKSVRKSRFAYNRSKSADNPMGLDNVGESNRKPRKLSNQFPMEMAKRIRCSSEDVVDDAGRSEDLDDIQVHIANSRSFGLSSSFLRRKKDEYEGDDELHSLTEIFKMAQCH